MSRMEMCLALKQVGISRVTVGYDGYGDEGQFDSVTCCSPGGGEVEVGDELRDKVEDAVYDCLETMACGWQDNDGSCGEIEIDIDRDVVMFYHRTRHTVITDHKFQMPLVGGR